MQPLHREIIFPWYHIELHASATVPAYSLYGLQLFIAVHTLILYFCVLGLKRGAQ